MSTPPTYDLPLIHCRGTAQELGQAYGQQCSEAIRAFVTQRLRAAKVYLWERGSRDLDGFLAIGAQCYRCFCDWDPQGADEHTATAIAAGVDPAELYTATNMTDIRDVFLVQQDDQSTPAGDGEGCSAVVLPASRTASGTILAAQTWDLNPQDVDDIIAVYRRPNDRPATWSVTCNGCPTLVGINEHGLAVGTTNIKTTDARIGVGYLSLLHRAIACSTVAEAAECIASAPRAAAHTYWLADSQEARLLTCSATAVVSENGDSGPLLQTNHLRAMPVGAESLEPANSSSNARLCHMQEWAADAQGIDFPAMVSLFSDRSRGADSINRYPEDQTGTATDACFVCCPSTRQTWACRGPADRGIWYNLDVNAGIATPITHS